MFCPKHYNKAPPRVKSYYIATVIGFRTMSMPHTEKEEVNICFEFQVITLHFKLGSSCEYWNLTVPLNLAGASAAVWCTSHIAEWYDHDNTQSHTFKTIHETRWKTSGCLVNKGPEVLVCACLVNTGPEVLVCVCLVNTGPEVLVCVS